MREFPFFIVLSVDQLALCCPKSPKMHFFSQISKKNRIFRTRFRFSWVLYIKGKQKVKKMGIEKIYLRKFMQGNTKNTIFASRNLEIPKKINL